MRTYVIEVLVSVIYFIGYSIIALLKLCQNDTSCWAYGLVSLGAMIHIFMIINHPKNSECGNIQVNNEKN
jgi:hypothetical protein